MGNGKYVLDDDLNPVLEPDLLTWGRWFETANRLVAEAHIGRYRVSTIFLGLDHNFLPTGPPLLYETMCFPARDDGMLIEDYCDRYTTRAEALEGHKRAIEWAKTKTKKEQK